jgi:DNA polymerase-1
VKKFIDHTVEAAHRDGFVTTLLGRRRYLPDINAGNANLRKLAERIAVNTPIQGTSADMIKVAMIRVDARIRAEGFLARMILQVHDELIFDAPEDEIDRLRPLVIKEMVDALPLRVPVLVFTEVGDNWAEV